MTIQLKTVYVVITIAISAIPTPSQSDGRIGFGIMTGWSRPAMSRNHVLNLKDDTKFTPDSPSKRAKQPTPPEGLFDGTAGALTFYPHWSNRGIGGEIFMADHSARLAIGFGMFYFPPPSYAYHIKRTIATSINYNRIISLVPSYTFYFGGGVGFYRLLDQPESASNLRGQSKLSGRVMMGFEAKPKKVSFFTEARLNLITDPSVDFLDPKIATLDLVFGIRLNHP